MNTYCNALGLFIFGPLSLYNNYGNTKLQFLPYTEKEKSKERKEEDQI